MTLEEIQKHEYIWAFMYGEPTMRIWSSVDRKEHEEPDKLVRIKTSRLIKCADDNKFMYIWGWPGPDYNLYKITDYKETWCFHPNEIPNAQVYELDMNILR